MLERQNALDIWSVSRLCSSFFFFFYAGVNYFRQHFNFGLPECLEILSKAMIVPFFVVKWNKLIPWSFFSWYFKCQVSSFGATVTDITIGFSLPSSNHVSRDTVMCVLSCKICWWLSFETWTRLRLPKS